MHWPATILKSAGIVALMMMLTSCVRPGYYSGPDTTPERLFSVGYKNLSERYIDPLDMGELSLAGLVTLTDVDPEIRVSASGGNVTLVAANGTVGEWRSPDKNDASGWARLIGEMLARARAVSVLPTPVGPRKMNEPIGLSGSCRPARARRTAFEIATRASSCPTTRGEVSLISHRSTSFFRMLAASIQWPTR